MKEWAWILILLSLFGMIAKALLPKGEKSPLHSPLRFLLSLALIAVVFSPLISLIRGEGDLSESISSLLSEEGEMADTQTLVLKRFAEVLGQKVKETFPDAEFSLEIHTDENKVPVTIKVVSTESESAQRIADFIEISYGIESEPK